ncbi:hypothetical protein O3G_MSEX012375 [Manduca sexta]|uniref:Uncharacterized protein n=1 Tax=Manduca sexta TaxID=7130 RepID=A0A921ZNP2_MANSE|nr:hypothetical protein O3G_MSEX012375 [Manduca sexta]
MKPGKILQILCRRVRFLLFTLDAEQSVSILQAVSTVMNCEVPPGSGGSFILLVIY